jgi:HK97 family phage major capsid protein
VSNPIPAAITTKVDEIMASARARFGHDAFRMELDDEASTNLATSMDDLRGKTPEELDTMLKVLDAHLRSLHQTDTGELRDKDEAEQAAFDLGMQIRDKIFEKLENHKKISEVFRQRPESVKRVYQNIRNGVDDSPSSVARLTRSEARDRALRVLDSREARSSMNDEQKSQVERMVSRSTDIARRVIVTENDAYREAFHKLVTNPNGHMLLDDDERAAIRAFEEYRGMAEGTGSAGGYGVPVFIDPSIILTAQGSANPFLTIATQKDINTNVWKGVSSDGVSWSFDAEGAAVSDDSPTLAQPAVNVYTARGFIPYTIEVGEDYPGFASEMSTLLTEGYDELLVDKFTRGSGTGEPLGIVTALDADSTAEVLLGTAGTLASADVAKGYTQLPQRFRRNAVWLTGSEVSIKIRQLGPSAFLSRPNSSLADVQVDPIAGRAMYETPYMTDLTNTSHTNVAVIGDFRNYVVARRGGMNVELVPQLFDVTTGRPTGRRGWFAYARIGGGPSTNKAFKLVNQT